MSAGGYNAVVPAGTYTVTASGGPLRFPITKANIQVSNQNVWLNFLYDPNSVPADAYEAITRLAAPRCFRVPTSALPTARSVQEMSTTIACQPRQAVC